MTDEVFDATGSVDVVGPLSKQEVYYELIGRFVARFSEFEWHLKWCVAEMAGVKHQYFRAVFAHMPIGVALDAFSGSINIYFADEKERERWTKLANDARKINNKRVDVVHSTWVRTSDGLLATRVSRQINEAVLFTDPSSLTKLVDEVARVRNELGDLELRVMDLLN